MNKRENPIVQKATWKKAALFTMLFAVFYIVINYSGIGAAGLLNITGGANILDFEFGYNQVEAYQMLTALGTDGRSFYLTKILPLDFPFPFVYSLCFAGWIALLIKRTTNRDYNKFLLLLPVFTMLFDWIENVGVISMLNSYPNLSGWAVSLASVAGMLKTVFTIGNIVVIGLLFIIFLIKRRAGR